LIGLAPECFLQFRQKGGYPFSLLDGLKGYAVYPGAPFVGTDKGVGMAEDVCPEYLVIEGRRSGRLVLAWPFGIASSVVS